MSGFVVKKVKTKTLGERIRESRERKGDSLEDAAKKTQIQFKHLKQLEEGDYRNLPADVYVRGFLRSYAEYLEENENYWIKLYEKERQIQSNLGKDDTKTSTGDDLKISQSGLVITPKTVSVAVIVLITVILFGYLYFKLSDFIANPKLIILNPENEAVVSSNEVDVKGRTDADSVVFINNNEVATGNDGEFQGSVFLQNGSNLISIRVVNRFNKETSKTISVNANFDKPKEEVVDNNEEDGSGEELSVEEYDFEIFAKNSKIEVFLKSEEDILFDGAIEEGESKKFKFKDEIKVSSTNGKNTFVSINGEDKGSLSTRPTKVVDMVFFGEDARMDE